MTAPGWYRDPWRAARARWFDGRRWTDRTANPAGPIRRLGLTAGLTASDPLPEIRKPEVDPDSWATWSLALGIAAIVFSFSFVLAPLGVLTGAAAVVTGVRGLLGWSPRQGRALVGFLLGAIALGFALLLFGAAAALT